MASGAPPVMMASPLLDRATFDTFSLTPAPLMRDALGRSFTTVDGVRLSYKLRRPQEGSSGPSTCILLLHGIGLGLMCFERLARELHAGALPHATILSIDLFGHGLSESPTESHDQETLASYASKIASALHLCPNLVVGHSTGCCVACAYASLRHAAVRERADADVPSLAQASRAGSSVVSEGAVAFEASSFPIPAVPLDGLVLISPIRTSPEGCGARALRLAAGCCGASCLSALIHGSFSPTALLRSERPTGAATPAVDRTIWEGIERDIRAELDLTHSIGMHKPWARSVGLMRANVHGWGRKGGRTSYIEAALLQLPVLVVSGDLDRTAPHKDAHELHELFAAAARLGSPPSNGRGSATRQHSSHDRPEAQVKLMTVRGAKHLVMMERAGAVASAIAAFVSEVGLGYGGGVAPQRQGASRHADTLL